MDIFEEIVLHCDGMLSPAVYRSIFSAGQRGGLIVEVGTALGAGTVALALGLRSSGLPGKVISFDPMDGGPRRQIATPATRVEHVRRSLQHFGVDHLVELVTSSLPDGLHTLPHDEPISVLMLDADGRIDRDLLAVYDRIAPDGSIIIDDLADLVRLKRTGLSSYTVDAKMRLAYRLVQVLKADGLISPGQMIKETYFGAKGGESSRGIDPLRMLEVYRELVFTDTRLTALGVARRLVVRRLEAAAPGLLQRLRVQHRRSIRAAITPSLSSLSDWPARAVGSEAGRATLATNKIGELGAQALPDWSSGGVPEKALADAT